MRWPREKNKKNKTTKKEEKQRKESKKHKNTIKRAFQLSVKFFFFWGGCSKIPFFDNLAQKARTPKNTIKIGVSARHFCKNSYASRNGHVWTKNIPNAEIPVIFFFLAPFFSVNNKKQKICRNPYFYSVLANLKKENFQKMNLKQRNLKNPIFAPFFVKKAIFRKLPDNWAPTKTQNDNCVCQKSLETTFL